MTEFSFRTRRRNLERMAGEVFDLLVIGGGIHGAGVARDAAMRGLKVALVEKGDYASGTSSKSSKLIHGGLRYLEHFEFGLVRESCRERATLLRIAPHLVRPMRFLMPIYKGDRRPAWLIGCGMKLYDAFSPEPLQQSPRVISRERALSEEPSLEAQGLTGAGEFWDCQENDARFCLANIGDATKHGAVCANYLEVAGFGFRSDRIERIQVRDRIAGNEFEIQARTFVNAGGPWVDRIAALEAGSEAFGLRRTKGVHLVTHRLTQGAALVLQARRDGRVFFVLPYGPFHSLIGTTDTDYDGDPDAVPVLRSDIEYLLEETNRVLPSARLGEPDVLGAFAGLRPLLQQPGCAPSDVSRRHRLTTSPNGLISIIGGKFTTYRAVAEEVVDLVCRKFDFSARPCATATEPLAEKFTPDLFGIEEAQRRSAFRRDEPNAFEDWRTECLADKVRYAVDCEMVMTPGDFLFRRTNLGYTVSRLETVAYPVGVEMKQLLGWDESEMARQLTSLQ